MEAENVKQEKKQKDNFKILTIVLFSLACAFAVAAAISFILGAIGLGGFFVGAVVLMAALGCVWLFFSNEFRKWFNEKEKNIESQEKVLQEEVEKLSEGTSKKATKQVACVKCGKKIDADSAYCKHCGKKQAAK